MPESGGLPAISVVVPTYHRPVLLAGAVESLLRQDVDGRGFEVVISVSDADAPEDLAVARRLAADSRVRVVVAPRIGPAAARNAGVDTARAPLIAFLDDDCVARPGWLAAMVRRLSDVDLVQGRTVPAESTEGKRYAYSIHVDRLTWLWETCNLAIRRSALERGGRFDEAWNPVGRPGTHWGEDAEWGWRVVRAGARHAFEPEAVVEHAVFERTYRQALEFKLRVRYLPLLLRRVPELRKSLVLGVFANRAQVRATVAVTGLGAAAAARVSGRRMVSRGITAAVAVMLLHPVRGYVRRIGEDFLVLGASIVSSIRHRRVVL